MPKRETRILGRSYCSQIDGTRQPYAVYLPRGFARPSSRRRGRPRPLLVWLHGFGGAAGFFDECLMDLADEFGYVVALPRGRGSVFYDGPGEEDVMEVVRRVRKEFGASLERTFVAGASMGGTGALRLPARYPHEFAAALSICGWSHPEYWYRKWYGPADRPDSVHPAHARLLACADTVPALQNLLHVPVYIMHGARDNVVDAGESRAALGELSRLGYEVFYKEYARSRHRAFRRNWRAVFRWFEGGGAHSWLGRKPGKGRRRTRLKRVPDSPREVRFLSLSPARTRAYWAELDPADCNLPSRMRLLWDGSAILAETENVSRLTLFRKGSPWGRPPGGTKELVLRWRGEELRAPVRTARMCDLRAEALPAVEFELDRRKGTKRPGLSGPISDAFRAPFLVVAGSGAAAREARLWADAWNAWLVPEGAKGIRLRAPSSVSRTDANSSHLLLFGTPAENPLVKKVASRMDVSLSRRRIRLWDREWKAPRQGHALGLRMIRPGPFAPEKYALVFFGEMGERTKQMETLGWYWPDWIVFDEGAPARRTAHPDWTAHDEAVAALRRAQDGDTELVEGVAGGEIDPDEIDPRGLPLQYLPDKWLDAGFFDASWKLA